MSKADVELRKKTMKQLLTAVISTILLITFLIIDILTNPLSILNKKEDNYEVGIHLSDLGLAILIIITLFFLFSFVFALIQFLKKKRRMNTDFLKFAVDMMDIANVIPIFMAIFFMIDALFISFASVKGHSMEPNFYNSDYILVQHSLNYNNDDVVIVELDDGTLIIKRIVAKEGDHLFVDIDGVVVVNDEVVESDLVNGIIGRAEPYNKVLEKGEYYVLGDNRHNSLDSRIRGVFTSKDLCGKVKLIILPFKRFGKVE